MNTADDFKLQLVYFSGWPGTQGERGSDDGDTEVGGEKRRKNVKKKKEKKKKVKKRKESRGKQAMLRYKTLVIYRSNSSATAYCTRLCVPVYVS